MVVDVHWYCKNVIKSRSIAWTCGSVSKVDKYCLDAAKCNNRCRIAWTGSLFPEDQTTELRFYDIHQEQFAWPLWQLASPPGYPTELARARQPFFGELTETSGDRSTEMSIRSK